MTPNVNFLYVINGYYIVLRNDKRIGTLKNLNTKFWYYCADLNDDKTYDDEQLDAYIKQYLETFGAGVNLSDVENVKKIVLNAIDTWELTYEN